MRCPDGDWAEVERLLQKLNIKNNKVFLYAIYKQQYLEMIDSGEQQKAFSFLTKRLKPLESLQSTPEEFRDLCYLLTCKSVQDAPSFRTWEDIGPSRCAPGPSALVCALSLTLPRVQRGAAQRVSDDAGH